jgi:hypothetical protein
MTIGTTVYPSTTGVAYVPFLYGAFPGTAGVPGIRWLDRVEAARGLAGQWRGARSYCGVQAGWLNRDLRCGPSIFELVPESYAVCTPLTNGLQPGRHLIPGKRALLGSLAHYAGTYPALDRAVADAWLDVATRDWRFLFVVFPGPDGLAHLYDPWHNKVLESFREIDRALGAFQRRARQVGEDPALIVASDHGASVMPHHEDIALRLEEWGVPTLRHPMHVWRRGARAAVMVSGNAGVQLYFDPRSGRPTPLTERDLPHQLVDRLVALPAVRVAAYRDDDGGVIVRAGGDRARLRDENGVIHYEALAGDPLGLGGTLRLADCEMLLRSRSTDVPDAPRQLLQLFRTARAGDLALAANIGSDFRGPWEIPEHKSGHGSVIADHAEVPILANVPLPDVPLRTVDLMPAMLELLDVPVPPGLDGVPFSQLGVAGGRPPVHAVPRAGSTEPVTLSGDRAGIT